MRKLFIAAALCAAGPAQAFDRMLLGDCLASAEQLTEMVWAPDDAEMAHLLRSISATFDGWCKINGGDPGFENAEFDTLLWRTEDTSRWTIDGIPPLALQFRITGLEPDRMQASAPTNRPPITVEAVIRQNPDIGQVVIEHAEMSNETGDRMTLSAVFDRVFLSSQSMMMVSLGSVAFQTALFSLTLEGIHENPFAFGVDDDFIGNSGAQRAAAFETITRLPSGVFDDASLAALTAFAGDLPSPVGTLEMTVNSERGLGLMQLGGALNGMETGTTVEAAGGAISGFELEILLDGITASANWSRHDGQSD